jgi:hypothetical protein
VTATLQLSADLALPLDAVTQTFAILARKGSGKTFTLRLLLERLFKAGQQIVDVDPKGDHWGVRSSADGKGSGIGCLILGGEHGDLPLEPGSGELVAKLVVEERVSAVLDLSLLRKHEVATFMTAFLETFYRLKAREQFRTPVMLFVDEADAIAPQKPPKGTERMLGAIEDIVRRGRQRGIGCTLVTQRSAVLNKNVLTQAQVMIAMRTIAPQDLEAMDAWIEVHGTKEQRALLMGSLPSLPRGDAWVWSPGWPSDEGIFKRIHVDLIETFDSGATPRPGEKRVEPKQRADVDLEALRRQMAATVERAKASDPALLRKRIAELERQVSARPAAAPPVPPKEVRVPVLEAEHLRQMQALVDALVKWSADFEAFARRIGEAIGAAARAGLVKGTGVGPAIFPPRGRLVASGVAGPAPKPVPPAPRAAREVPEGALPKGERVVLTAVAQHVEGVTREQLTVLTGYKRSSRDSYLQRLREKGLTEDGERIVATQAGIDALGGAYQPLPTGAALLEYWRGRLPLGERVVLDVVVEAWPGDVERDHISQVTEYQRSSRDSYLQRLMARELVTGPCRGQVRASDMLFDGAGR